MSYLEILATIYVAINLVYVLWSFVRDKEKLRIILKQDARLEIRESARRKRGRAQVIIRGEDDQ